MITEVSPSPVCCIGIELQIPNIRSNIFILQIKSVNVRREPGSLTKQPNSKWNQSFD